MFHTAAFTVVLCLVVVQAARLSPSGLTGDPLHREATKSGALNERPLIGIVSQAVPGQGSSYIAASYVKFVEMAGARAVPFLHDMTTEEVKERFLKVNGILLPGGGAPLEPGSGYYDVSAQLLQLAKEANDAGTVFPVLGTCLGFEAMVVAVSQNTSILESFEAGNNEALLEFTDAAASSRFFSTFSPALMAEMAVQHLTAENHEFGIDPETFLGNERLNDMFQILSTSYDRNRKKYVSTVEARKWHAEKNAFEWATFLNVAHSEQAVEVTFALAKNLVNMARMNLNHPNDINDELDILIYNYPVLYTAKLPPESTANREGGFMQVYKFPDREPEAAKSHFIDVLKL